MRKFIQMFINVFSAVLLILFMYFNISSLMGKYDISYNGFAVDNLGNIYVGYTGEIKVFNNNKMINSISPFTSRGYNFTITNNNLLIDIGSKAYLAELNGDIIETYENSFSDKWHQFRPNKNEFITDDGTVYSKSNSFGRIAVSKKDSSGTEEKVFTMPIGDYCAKLIFTISFIVFFPELAYIVYKANISKYKNKKTTPGNQSGGGYSIDPQTP